MCDHPLVAHSLIEAHLYLLATPCSACGKGSLDVVEVKRENPQGDHVAAKLFATCGACEEIMSQTFIIPTDHAERARPGVDAVNPTSARSRIIDVGQWIALHRILIEAATNKVDAAKARYLYLQAAQCLDEAMKFYDEAEDLPPENAFFTEVSRQRLNESSDQFSKKRLIDLRSKLPRPVDRRKPETEQSDGKTKQRWWKR